MGALVKKVFVSYSGTDEALKEELMQHLSALRHQGLIKTWNHKDILAGQNKFETIDANLVNSDIILLLISNSFISSDYLYTEELRTAINMHSSQKAIVIPIKLKPCFTEGMIFDPLQSFPTDKAITSYPDRDEAMAEVASQIARLIKEMPKQPLVTEFDASAHSFHDLLHSNFVKWLNDTEVVLKNRHVENVHLDDIFIFPDIKNLNQDDNSYKESSLDTLIDQKGYFLVFGEEQSGKTAIVKSLYKDALKKSYFPVYIDADKLSEPDLSYLVAKCIQDQYLEKNLFSKISPEKIVLIIDNICKKSLNSRNTDLFLEQITISYETCIIFASDSYQYVVPDNDGFAPFDQKEILPFGNYKRELLIGKWVSLGTSATISDTELYTNVDKFKSQIDSLVRRNVVPPKPIYLLSLLQMFEAYNPQKIDLTSYGHCYQHLVYQALEKSNINANEIEKYFNVMTELAWAQLLVRGGLTEQELEKFFKNYAEKFIGVDGKKIIGKLLDCSILTFSDDKYKFKYPYIYYFFAAKYISENYSKQESVRESFSYLLENLHKEDCANIIIFITHHTKDDWILDEIQICMMELFDDHLPETLTKDNLEFMSSLIEDIPELVLEKRKVENERKKHALKLDEEERKESNIDEQISELKPNDTFAKINKAFKGIEVMGQIVRNRYASLPRENLQNIIEGGYFTGLRFLSYFLQLSNLSKTDIINVIENILKENPKISNSDLEKEATHYFLLMTYGVIFGVLKKISSSMGGAEIEEICLKIERDHNSPAIKLINQSMELNHRKKLDFARIDQLQKDFKSNPVCGRMLRENIILHTYMFPVEYRDKQRLSQSLKISMQQQRKLDRSRGGKMLPPNKKR